MFSVVDIVKLHLEMDLHSKFDSLDSCVKKICDYLKVVSHRTYHKGESAKPSAILNQIGAS